METYTKEFEALSDTAVLSIVGNFIKEQRIRLNKTQQVIANNAGVNRSTVMQIESGKGGNMLSFIQLLRAVNQLEVLKIFEISNQISPVALAKAELARRKRASKTVNNIVQEPPLKYTW